MKIALDATYSLGPALSGVGVYCARLIKELTAAAPESQFLLCYRPNRFFRALLDWRPAPNVALRLMQEPVNVFLARRVELFHGLNQRLPHYRFRLAVTTFHDLFVMSGQYSTTEFRRRFTELARSAAARSDLILCVSHYTAGQVQSLLGVEPSRLRVVHHGVDPIAEFPAGDLADFRRRYRIERPFLLHVGAVQTRKNIIRLVEAFESLGLEGAPERAPEGGRGVAGLELVLAGSDGYGAAEIHARIAASPARERIRALGYVARPVVERLYRTAAVLVFPSLEEGFGMPVLEAMSAGLPVVTSNRSALAEVADDAALLVDPADSGAIAAGLRCALQETAWRQELIDKGLKRAAQFRWPRAAAETLQVYRSLV